MTMLERFEEEGEVEHFAWPGVYPLFYYVYADNEHFHCCPDCVNDNEFEKIEKLDKHVNWEDHGLYCDTCNDQIASAYGENQQVN